MKILGASVTSMGMVEVLARFGNLPLIVMGGLLMVLCVAAMFFFYRLVHQVVLTPEDAPALRLESLLRVTMGRPDPSTASGDPALSSGSIAGSIIHAPGFEGGVELIGGRLGGAAGGVQRDVAERLGDGDDVHPGA